MATNTLQPQSYNQNAAPLHQQIIAQARVELLLTLRRGESVLITLVVPVLLLIFFASLNIIPATTGKAVDFLLPGILALAVIATGMVSLGIATAYERYYGVLKRLGASPLPRAGLIAAKALSVLVLEVLQVALLVVIAAAAYGWRPPHSGAGLATAALALLLGTAAFAGLGLALARLMWRRKSWPHVSHRPLSCPRAPDDVGPPHGNRVATCAGRRSARWRSSAPRRACRDRTSHPAHPALWLLDGHRTMA